MRAALSWLGLDWDAESTQSENRGAHEAALDELAASGALYPCTCTRSDVRSAGIRAADGGWRYPGTCRERPLPPGGWRESGDALRLRLAPGRVDVRDEDGTIRTMMTVHGFTYADENGDVVWRAPER